MRSDFPHLPHQTPTKLHQVGEVPRHHPHHHLFPIGGGGGGGDVFSWRKIDQFYPTSPPTAVGWGKTAKYFPVIK